jgi:hypothetical protein
MRTKIINIHHGEKYDVYIGREGKGQDGYFGNPLRLDDKELLSMLRAEYGNLDNRELIIRGYKEYFLDRINKDTEFKNRILDLKGKTLGCFCVPKTCHGMVIIEYLDGISVEDQLKALNVNKSGEIEF